MQKKTLPVGIEDFEEIRKEDFYYIDKTGLIRDLLKPCQLCFISITVRK